MVKFISSKHPEVKIGGKSAMPRAMQKLIQKADRVIQARFMANGDISILTRPSMRKGKK